MRRTARPEWEVRGPPSEPLDRVRNEGPSECLTALEAWGESLGSREPSRVDENERTGTKRLVRMENRIVRRPPTKRNGLNSD